MVCIWMKPVKIFTRYPLFSYVNEKREPLIRLEMSKMKKESQISLRILNKVVVKEMVHIPFGEEWNHLCLQWQGSTGYWVLFVNNTISSLGRRIMKRKRSLEINEGGVVYLGDAKANASIELYGLYLVSIDNLNSTHIESKVTNKTRTVIRKRVIPNKDTVIASASDIVQETIPKDVEVLHDNDSEKGWWSFLRFSKMMSMFKRILSLVVIPLFTFMRNIWLQTTVQEEPVTEIIKDFHNVDDEVFSIPDYGKEIKLEDFPIPDEFNEPTKSTNRPSREILHHCSGSEKYGKVADQVPPVMLLYPENQYEFGFSLNFVKFCFSCCTSRIEEYPTILSWDNDVVFTRKNNVFDISKCGQF